MKNDILNCKDQGLLELINGVQKEEPTLGAKSIRIIELCYKLMKAQNIQLDGVNIQKTEDSSEIRNLNPLELIKKLMQDSYDSHNCDGKIFIREDIYSYLSSIEYTNMAMHYSVFCLDVIIKCSELLAKIGITDNTQCRRTVKYYYIFSSEQAGSIVIVPEYYLEMHNMTQYTEHISNDKCIVICGDGINYKWLVAGSMKDIHDDLHRCVGLSDILEIGYRELKPQV